MKLIPTGGEASPTTRFIATLEGWLLVGFNAAAVAAVAVGDASAGTSLKWAGIINAVGLAARQGTKAVTAASGAIGIPPQQEQYLSGITAKVDQVATQIEDLKSGKIDPGAIADINGALHSIYNTVQASAAASSGDDELKQLLSKVTELLGSTVILKPSTPSEPPAEPEQPAEPAA